MADVYTHECKYNRAEHYYYLKLTNCDLSGLARHASFVPSIRKTPATSLEAGDRGKYLISARLACHSGGVMVLWTILCCTR